METITINGKTMEAEWVGATRSGASTLVFLHEGLGCLRMWKNFPRKLAKKTDCNAFVYSRLGYGFSDPCELPRPLDYMQREGTKMLPAVLETAGVEEYILVGHSDGGSIALVHAGQTHSVKLKGVITEAAHLFCEPLSVRSIDAMRDEYLNGDLKEKLTRYHGDNVECAFRGWNDAWLDPGFLDWNIEGFLPGIDVPVLAIQGMEDQYGTVAQLEAIARNVGNGAEILLFEGCGHAPHHEKPDETLDAMAAFVRRVLG